jgi:signal transduction histidine kinase
VPSEEVVEDAWESVNRALQRIDTLEKRIRKLDPLAVGVRGRRVSRHSTEDILREVADAFADDLDRHGVTLDFRGNSRTEATTNREVVQHAFSILLDNSLWFARQGGDANPVVTVRVTKSGFTVSDSGPGIPESDRDAIFEPHFTTREGGHGLGLTLARDLLKSIGARIRLANCRPARFSVELGRD